MEALQIFNYNGSQVSFQTKNGIVYASATDMAKPFGKRPNDYITLASTRAYLEAITRKNGNANNQVVMIDRGGNNPGSWYSEDLALDFAQWLDVDFKLWCNDRIKELLKHGATAINPSDLLNPDFIINLATQLKNERAENERLLITSQLQSKQLVESAPKVMYFDTVLQSETAITTTIIAKDNGMSAESLNNLLHKKGIIYKMTGTWVLYGKYQDKGYTKSKVYTYVDGHGVTKTNTLTCWTEAGRQFIHNILQDDKV